MPRISSQSGNGRILLVDDDHVFVSELATRLSAEGHDLVEASTPDEAVAALHESVAVSLVADTLSDTRGLDIMRRLRQRRPMLPVLILTKPTSVRSAVAAMKAGASDVLLRTDGIDAIAEAIARAMARVCAPPGSRPDEESPVDEILVGRSEPMRRVKRLIHRLAESRASTVLLTGESGTGKNLVAQALHSLGRRAKRPFVNIMCSAIPSGLLESELFGHERGAFTDAKATKEGLLERADGGTVFLDEIGELELPLQAKLLHFLEEKSFRRVGGTEELSTDVRIVAATNVELEQAVQRGNFRADLYYRLAVVAVDLPPLRERDGDIELLVTYLVRKFSRELEKAVTSVSPGAMRMLKSHPWPGNVRQLRNALERAVLLADRPVLTIGDFEFMQDTQSSEPEYRLPATGVDIEALERSLVEQALERTGGNKTRAGELLCMTRDQVRYRVEKFGLSDRF